MALGDVLLLPDDDLALAAVLKSPLFGLDDDDLMALAHGRQQSLWAQLQAHAGGRWPAGGSGQDAGALARRGRPGAAVRILRRCARPRRRPRPHAHPPRHGGRRRHRRAPQPGAGLRRDGAADAARLPRPPAPEPARDQARHGAGPRRGAGDDRARRQGPGGTHRVPARHLLHPLRPSPQRAPPAGGRGAPERHSAAVPVAHQGHEQGRDDPGRTSAPQAGGHRGAQPPALRGPHPPPRPALRGGLRGRAEAPARLLVQPHQGGVGGSPR